MLDTNRTANVPGLKAQALTEGTWILRQKTSPTSKNHSTDLWTETMFWLHSAL